MRYLITGGGTGGHIYPALAIAMEIEEKDSEAEILYVGTEAGLESEIVPKEGLNFDTIRVKGMPRSLNKESFLAMKELVLGIKDSRKIIKKYKPDIVIGTGGYVCGPVVLVASMMKIPTVIHEQNAFPGVTNKILSRFVDRIMITFEESRKYFKNKDKVSLTGNPIRKTFFTVDTCKAYRDLELDRNKLTILSFGGSGGQKKLNDSMYYYMRNNQREDLQIVHVTGQRFFDDFYKRIEEDKVNLSDNIKIKDYVYNMPELLNVTDLIITSAGAITLAEISALGLPSILVPKGYTAENHQEYNARAFVNSGASTMILEKDLTGEVLEREINDIIENKGKLNKMASSSKKLGVKDAAGKIVDIIFETIKIEF